MDSRVLTRRDVVDGGGLETLSRFGSHALPLPGCRHTRTMFAAQDQITRPSVRPMERAMPVPRMDPQSIVFPA